MHLSAVKKIVVILVETEVVAYAAERVELVRLEAKLDTGFKGLFIENDLVTLEMQINLEVTHAPLILCRCLILLLRLE